MPDLAWNGITMGKKIADMADIYYMPLAAHNVCSPIGTMAACHTCASMRNFVILEFHAQDVVWWDDLVIGDRPMIQDGYIICPTSRVWHRAERGRRPGAFGTKHDVFRITGSSEKTLVNRKDRKERQGNQC